MADRLVSRFRVLVFCLRNDVKSVVFILGSDYVRGSFLNIIIVI